MTNYITQEKDGTPIFSSYKQIDKNFDENMDAYVPKSAYETYIEKESAKKINNAGANINALNNIPVVPDFAMKEYNQFNEMPKWYKELNVATEEEINEWKNKGKIGIAETWQRKKKWEMIPFAGSSAEATLVVRNANTLRRLKNGENISDVDKELLVDFLRDAKELEVRGHTLAGRGTDILMSSAPFMGEFAAALATLEGGVGFGVLSKTLSTIGAKKAAKAAMEKAVKEAAVKSTMTGLKKELSQAAIKEIGEKEFQNVIKGGITKALPYVGTKTIAKETLKAAPKIVGTSAKTAITRMPQHFIRSTSDKQISTGVYVTDAGQATFIDSENLALSIMKALGETTFDTLTETAGWTFKPVTKYFAQPVRKILPQKFFTRFEKLVSSRFGKPASEVLQKYGYDGVIEEMGEEVLNRFLCQTFGLNGLDEYNFDGFMNNVFYANNPEQWASEALAFSAMSMGGHAVAGSGAKMAEQFKKYKMGQEARAVAENANKRLYSPEEFYLDQGFIRIKGSQSLAEQVLREKFTQKGIDANTADEFLQNASEFEIRETLKNFRENERQTFDIKQSQAISSLRNRLFTQSLNAGREKDVAKSESEIMTQAMASLARISGKSIEEIENQMKLNIKALDVEDAKNLLKGNAKHNQDAIETAGAKENEFEAAKEEWREKGTESSFFKKWFGDSKVVDENGKPLLVYHRTKNDFDVFDKNLISADNLFGKGFYFSQADSRKNKQSYGKIRKEVYLSIQNPLTDNTILKRADIKPYLDNKNINMLFNGKDEIGGGVFLFNAFNARYDHNVNIDTTKILKNLGFDGIDLRNTSEGWVAFYPEQIKSVNNQGTFDANNPNIYYQTQNNTQKITPINIEVDSIPNFEKISELKNWIEENLNLIGIVNIKSNNRNVQFSKSNIGRSMKGTNRSEAKRNSYARLKELVENSVYSYAKPVDEKHSKRNNGQEIYHNAFSYDGDIYGIEISIDIPKTNYSEHNYAGHKIKIIKNTPAVNGTKLPDATGANISITDIQQLFNPNINNHEADIYFQSAYHGTPHRFDKFSTNNIGTGEGMQAHGWGLYFAENKEVSDNYRAKLVSRSLNRFNQYEFNVNSEPTSEDVKFYLTNNLSGSVLYNSANKENQDEFIKDVKWHIDYLKRGDTSIIKLIDLLQTEIDRIENNPKISISKFLNEVPKDYKYRIKSLADTAKKEAKKEGRRATIQDVLRWIKGQQEPFVNQRNSELEILAELEKLDINNLRITRRTGQLFEVDIPEIDALLDEQKDYKEQSQNIKAALTNLVKNETNAPIFLKYSLPSGENINMDGRQIYNMLSRSLGGDKNASIALNKYGIKGITYDGMQDGRCYVIFDDKAINILKTYYQGEDIDNARGFSTQRFNFDGTTKDNLIVLLKNKADKSTLLHEFAHVYLTTLNQLAKSDPGAQSQLITVNKWLRYNGKEYTTAQHEKFARGFEAYVKSGKAPTYALKRAFQNFKAWLNDIYKSITIGEMSKELELDDETKRVFDELLGDMTYDNQKKIADEILSKAKANASLRLNNDYTEKNHIKPRTLTDRQIRYRDTAYNILWYAVSHNKEAKEFIKDKKQLQMILAASNQKNNGLTAQKETLEFILREIGDVFSANDGFLDEWGEFFNDPGINENPEANTELVMQAYDVINNKKYLYDAEKYDEFSEADFNRTKYEYEYILNDYKEAKDRTATMIGFWEWIETVPDFIQEDFLKDWELKTNEIERYENLTRFEQAKEDLKIYAAKLKGQGDYSAQFAEYTRVILKRLDFMTELDKVKIFNKLKEYNSFGEIENNLDNIMDYAETLDAVSERKMLAENINKEVKQTIHEWQNGIKKTKYTYPANKLFERLRALSKLNQEEIQHIYDSQVNNEATISYEADAVHDEDYYETIEKMYVEFRANGQYYNSTEFLNELLDRIQQAKFTAKVARDEIDFERRMQQINLIDECGQALNEHKGKTSKLEEIYSKFFNLNSALEMMFNENIKNKFSLDYLYAKKDGKVGKDRDEVLNKIADVFGFDGPLKNTLLFNKFIDMTKPEFSIKQRYTPDKVNGTYRVTHTDKESGKNFTDRVLNFINRSGYKEWEDDEIQLSRMQVIYYYIQAKNPVSYEILTNMGDENTAPKGQFDKFEFNSLLENLTEQEKLMGDILQMAAEKYYPELNKYHIEKYHTELGKCKNYFPRKSEVMQEKIYEPYSDYVQQTSNPKFQKQRTAGPGIRIAPANPLEVLFDHIEKANTLIIMGKQLDLMNRVFNDVDLKKKVSNIWGDMMQGELYNQLAGNLYGGQTSTISQAEKECRNVMNNVIKAQIFAKPQVGLKQLLSFMNYGVGDNYVSTVEWFEEFAKQTLTPSEWKNNVDFMLENEYLKDRFSRGGSTEALKTQLETRLYAKLNLLDDAFSSFIRYGDIGAIILGGKPYIDVLVKKGYTKEQAFKIFIEKTVNDQQSSIPSTLSNIQRNAAKHPLTKMFFAYQNTPWQYFRTAYNSIIKFKQNPSLKTGLNAAKLCSLYLYLFPLLFNMASSLSIRIFMGSGDPEDIFTDLWRSCIGGFTFIPIVGSFINSIYTGLHGDMNTTGDWFNSAASKVNKVARQANKGELTLQDIFIATALFGEATTGLPVNTLGNTVGGVIDVAQGDIEKGLLKIGGYTDYRARKATGED